MDPSTVVNWLTTLGPFAVAGLLAYVWKLEREERKAEQAAKETLQKQLLEVALSSSKALSEQGETTRNELKNIGQRLERLEDPK